MSIQKSSQISDSSTNADIKFNALITLFEKFSAEVDRIEDELQKIKLYQEQIDIGVNKLVKELNESINNYSESGEPENDGC